MEKLIIFMTGIKEAPDHVYMEMANAKAKELYPYASEIEICRILSACNRKRMEF